MTACPIEDRIALEDLTVAFAQALDTIGDTGGICDCFTEDAVYDLTGIGMARVEGRAAIGDFFAGIFAANSHHAHYVSNFAVTGFGGDTAAVRCYVVGMARGKDGSALTINGRYFFECLRTPQGWRIAGFHMDFLIPPG